MEDSYWMAANKLGLAERLKAETQLLAAEFTGVNLEGLAPFDNEITGFDKETETRILENWYAEVALHPGMFPGALASVRDFKVVNNTLDMSLKRSRFDIFTGLKTEMPSRLNISEKPLDRDLCLYLCTRAVTVTAPDEKYPDGAIIFGIRHSDHAIGPRLSNCLPSGLFNPDKDRLSIGDSVSSGNFLSIRLTILRELIEETTIHDYGKFEYLGLVYENHMAPGIVIAIRLNIDYTVENIKKSIINADNESESYHFIANNQEAVKEFISDNPPTPHTASLLALHFSKYS